MKRWLVLSLVISSFFAALCPGQDTNPVTVTFYHTSDLHEHAAPMPRIARFVADKKKTDPNVIFLDTGDWFNKGDLSPLNTRGEAMVEMLAACRYDAVIGGNHEDSLGTQRFSELITRYSLPLLSANGNWPEGMQPKNVQPYKVFELKGVKVAVIGTTTPDRGNAIDPLLKVSPIAETVKELIEELAKTADIIVLMTHVGPPEDQNIARACPRLDIIFGGHHHSRFGTLNMQAETLTVIQHSGFFGEHIGEVVLTWDGARITDRNVRLIPVTPDMPEDAAVKAVHEKYLAARPKE